MFDFFLDVGNYESRKIARYEGNNDFFISTAAVSDGEQPYETAVCHPEYNGGEHVIVAAYPTRETAEKGHSRWVGVMTAAKLPAELCDCGNSITSKLCGFFGSGMTFRRKARQDEGA